MSKHTPGPWQIHRVNSDDVFILENRKARNEPVFGYNRKIAEMPHWSDENYNEKMANARLIVAAPDLLAAAKHAVEFFHGMHSGEPGDATYEKIHAYQSIVAAIAKAEGKE